MNRIDRLLADYRPRGDDHGPYELRGIESEIRTVEQALREIAEQRARLVRRAS